MPDHAKTDYGSSKTGQGAKIEDVIKVAQNAYTEGKDGVLPSIGFGEESEHHRYIFLYALLAIAIGTALVLCLYQIFVRHVVSVYNEDHPDGDGGDFDSDADEDEGELLVSPSSDEDDVKPLAMKRKGLGRSTTPNPGMRSKSASSTGSSGSKSKDKKSGKKKK